MRGAAGLLLIFFGGMAITTNSVNAQTLSQATSDTELFDAVFASTPQPPTSVTTSSPANPPPAISAVRPQSGGFVLPGADSLLVSANQGPSRTYIRQWPAALRVSAGGYDLAVSPHAGIGMSDNSDAAEAGATVSLGARVKQGVVDELDRLGVHEADTEQLKNHGRWFVFASASGSAVGLNIVRDAQGRYQRVGWSAEGSSALVSNAQVGVAWRRGITQASLGYVRRDIHADFGDGVASNHYSDSMVAFSLSIHP